MDAMTDAYLDWSLDTAEGGLSTLYERPLGGEVVEAMHRVYVVDLFCKLVSSLLHWPS